MVVEKFKPNLSNSSPINVFCSVSVSLSLHVSVSLVQDLFSGKHIFTLGTRETNPTKLLKRQPVLLKYNSYPIQFSYLKYTIQCFQIYQSCAPSPRSISEHFYPLVFIASLYFTFLQVVFVFVLTFCPLNYYVCCFTHTLDFLFYLQH